MPPDGFRLSFEAVGDDGLDPAALAARAEKERAALAALAPTMERVRTLRALHRWLFFEHEAYRGRRPATAVGAALASY